MQHAPERKAAVEEQQYARDDGRDANRGEGVKQQQDTEAKRHQQQSQIIVPLDAEGVNIKRFLPVFGYDDSPHGHMEIELKDVRVNAAGCLDRCELGPCVVIYPEGVWYSVRNKADIDEVLNVHVKQGGRVQRLMLQPDQRPPKG